MKYIAAKRKLHKFTENFKKVFKKNHLDFITALLSIPVLLSVIILNYNNLKPKQNTDLTPTPTQAEKIIVVPQNNPTNATSPNPTNAACKKDIGPIEITSPTENQTVNDNPVCINIKYADSNYCSVVWSYRVNNGAWSDYNTNNPCIYNLPNGNVKFELRVQSTVEQKNQSLTRNFVVQTSNPSSTSSAN